MSSLSDLAFVNVATADMDKDGIAEVMTSTRDTTQHWVRSIWHLHDTGDPTSFTGEHLVEDGDFSGITAADLVASDFDGDSVKATIATDGCRQVVEPQVRQVAWLPPFFRALQTDADKAASFGKSITGGTSNEQNWGSYTSHDISAYIGVDIGLDGIGGKVSAKATAGYNYQVANGETHSTENEQTLSQGWEQTMGEALVVYDENTFNCYSYDLADANGALPDSSARMCELFGHNGVTGDDAENWDTQIASAGGSGGGPPAQWFPLQRDWANLALFLPVTTNVTLPPETPASAVTDGLFSDSRASNGGATVNDPYVEVDLHGVRDITDIRVSPPPGAAIDLQGYRVYASASPFAGAGVPSGNGVRVFEPGTGDDMAYDRWNIWTRDSVTFAPMQARYIRLQHPGPATLDVAEIQVFGDVHAEPPMYPTAVCDPVAADGFFNAKVWDRVNATVPLDRGAWRPALDRNRLQPRLPVGLFQLRPVAAAHADLGRCPDRRLGDRDLGPQLGNHEPDRQHHVVRQLVPRRCRIRRRGRLHRHGHGRRRLRVLDGRHRGQHDEHVLGHGSGDRRRDRRLRRIPRW